MTRPAIQVTRGRYLHHLAHIHHGDAVRDVLDHRQVVGDEKVGQVELLLEVFQKVDDLRLDRAPEGRLAAARLADQAEGLPLTDGQIHAIHRADVTGDTADHARSDGKPGLEAAYLDQRFRH